MRVFITDCIQTRKFSSIENSTHMHNGNFHGMFFVSPNSEAFFITLGKYFCFLNVYSSAPWYVNMATHDTNFKLNFNSIFNCTASDYNFQLSSIAVGRSICDVIIVTKFLWSLFYLISRAHLPLQNCSACSQNLPKVYTKQMFLQFTRLISIIQLKLQRLHA